jgi:hypothetical protein
MNEAKNIGWVLDIETLGTESNAVILSAALVWFEIKLPFTIEELRSQSCFVKFNSTEQKEAGRSVSLDTLTWWREQTKEAQMKSLIPKSTDYSVVEGMQVLKDFFDDNGGTKVHALYSRGSFDVSGMDSLMKAFGIKPFLHWANARDVRTFIDCHYPSSGRGYVDVDLNICPDYKTANLVKHDPVDDCLIDVAMMLGGKLE